ncbi:hypothetical protein AUEXF2481DRAFT_35262 [Aureobasidium subglaciale EXF-2481]|uniref:ETS domain-containing protein n=1 Tax=Aureobasidium subglaciale (strain EXF-2481) TaxID=1043005 RepID=A0A074YNU0_AURSE|nr:uncharacterized protein AUEXF2481DRAFT_35262 [Aureobasidium subglaciale EXF-2481]KEQ99360.1 hypothetical protein AUEXF2481DRAFT_35262 [Aureobasidium subglaciale EXF-2481]
MEDARSSSPPPPSVNEPYRIPLFSYVTKTSSTSYTTDIRLWFAIVALSAGVLFWRGSGWEFALLALGGGVTVWKTARQREGAEYKRVRRALRV